MHLEQVETEFETTMATYVDKRSREMIRLNVPDARCIEIPYQITVEVSVNRNIMNERRED